MTLVLISAVFVFALFLGVCVLWLKDRVTDLEQTVKRLDREERS